MPCQIGITTNPERRKKEWQQKRSTLRNWQILETCQTQAAAQNAERKFADAMGCDSHPGGSGAGPLWYVYRFDY